MSSLKVVGGILSVGVMVGGVPQTLQVARAGSPAPFTDEALARGVDYSSGITLAKFGAGVAVVDMDNDSDPDIVGLGHKDGIVGIFENDGTGYFTNRSNGNGIPLVPEASGLSAVDYDSDGDLDLYITCDKFPNLLLRNDGNFQFTEVAVAAGVADQGSGQGNAWGDVNGDGWLDLFVANRTFPWTSLLPNEMYLNNQDGTFQPTGETLGIGQSDDPTFTVRFFDYDRDGDADFYLGNDHGTGPILHNHLFRNDGGTFVDVTATSHTEAEVDCMGIAIGDLDRNGYPDIYVTNIPSGNVLLMNQGDGTFTDETLAYGVGSYLTGWGTTFIDFDNDGWLDLYVNNMNGVNRMYSYTGSGMATDIAPALGLDNPLTSFCVAKGDLDNDGDLDLVVQTNDEPFAVFINNEGQNRNWVKFRVGGRGANTFAVGAQVDVITGVQTQMHEVMGNANFKSQDDYVMHFGLDNLTSIDQIIVTWPGGISRTLYNYSANHTWTLWPPERMGDADGDGDVDADDLNAVSTCINGPVDGSVVPGCEIIDMDGSGAVDLKDYAEFMAAAS